jgi:hypothetical protein
LGLKSNPNVAVTLAIFAGYVVLALLGPRDRGADAAHRLRKLQRRLREWLGATHVSK